MHPCDGPNGPGVIMGMLLFHYAVILQLYQLEVNFFGGSIFCPKGRITPQSFSPAMFSVPTIVGTAYLLISIGRTGNLLYITPHKTLSATEKLNA